MGLLQDTMQWLVWDGMCDNFVISAPLQSASCSKILAHQMGFQEATEHPMPALLRMLATSPHDHSAQQ
jgi:hypothetical protein